MVEPAGVPGAAGVPDGAPGVLDGAGAAIGAAIGADGIDPGAGVDGASAGAGAASAGATEASIIPGIAVRMEDFGMQTDPFMEMLMVTRRTITEVEEIQIMV